MELSVVERKLVEEKLELLRKPFEADQIEKLPKYIGKKGPDGKVPKTAYGVCPECNKRHPLPAVHLDYVGHAGITERLNEVDPFWNWEPMSVNPAGLPLIVDGGMWIKLTVLGITRIGFGDAQGKTGPNAIKEIIGDAIRNAAMRFGVATYLWSKSERAESMREYADEEPPAAKQPKKPAPVPRKAKPAPKKPEGDPLLDAKRVCTEAMRAYAAKTGADEKKLSDGVKVRAKQMNGENDPDFWLMVADEFRTMS